MFGLISIVLCCVFLFSWIFGKLVWNFIDYTIFFIFIISICKNFFHGLEYFIIQFNFGVDFIEKLDKVKRYLFEEKVEDVSEFLLATVLIGLMCIQINYNIPIIRLADKSNIELLGFIVSIFSMYGIYIGFLQYLASDIKADIYLGKSKVNYLIKKSFWYYLTQSKLFVMMLLTTVIVPIVIKLNIDFIRELTILWQTSYLLLLGIYIFLLRMSLYIIRVALLMKSKDDEDLKYNIKRQIQQEYTEIFWLFYNKRDRYQYDFIKNKLTRDFAKLDVNEYEEFIINIFDLKYFDSRNLYWSILNKIDKGFKLTRVQKFRNKVFSNNKLCPESYRDKNERNLKQMWIEFYSYLNKFIFNKWIFMKQYQDNFSLEVWKKIILEDLSIVDKIVKNNPTLAALEIERSNKRAITFLQANIIENVREFLFNLLIEKKGINLNEVLKDLEYEIQNFKENENDQFYRYTYDFLKFRLLRIIDKYENESFDLNLPKFQRLSDNNVFQSGERNDYENSMFYSKICFNYLDRGRIEDFSQNKIKKSDDDKLEKQKNKAQKIKNLILSLNEEYRLAFMLYQLFYTDKIQWDNNLEFYDTEIKKIMNYDKLYCDYLFNQAKKIIISETMINHRITENFLNNLWETRNAIIKDFSWFDQFGNVHGMSDFKIFYIQYLLSEKKFSHFHSRFDIDRNFVCENKEMEYFCREYLMLIDKLATIFVKEAYSHKRNNIQTSIEYIFHCVNLNLSDVICDISVSGLLRLEWILRWTHYHYNQESSYTNRTFFDAQFSNNRYYWSGGDGILEFYIIKIIDDFYNDCWKNEDFLNGFGYQLESKLNSFNKTVEEYVESIVEKVSGIENISILKKTQIISNLNEILKSRVRIK